MSYETILLHLDDQPHCAERARVAANLALSLSAHLIGLYAVDHFPLVLATRIPALGEEREKRQREMLRDLRENAAAVFRDVTTPLDLSTEWHSLEDDPLGSNPLVTVSSYARYADLVVIGQSDPGNETPSLPKHFPEVLCLSAGGPVLIVPSTGSFAKVGEHVLLAWNATREAARSVKDAIPILKRAEKVSIVTVVDPMTNGGNERDLATYLARHGITARAISIHAADAKAGEVLLSQAVDLGVDLLVMGAYGHSRVSELVLGGATRTVLKQMTLPVLMSH